MLIFYINSYIYYIFILKNFFNDFKISHLVYLIYSHYFLFKLNFINKKKKDK